MKHNIINKISMRVSMWLLVIATLAIFTANHKVLAQTGTMTTPTPIKGNELKGDLFGSDEEYFFSFIAAPGEISVNLDVKATSVNAGVTLEIFDSNGRSLTPEMLVQGLNRGSGSAMRKATITSQQTIILRLKDIRYYTPSCRGNFVIRLDGSIQSGPNNAPGAQNPVPDNSQSSNANEFPALPQSANPMKPTVLDRTSFSGKLIGSGSDSIYSFAAGPGDITLTLAVIATANNAEAMLDLLDSSANPLLAKVDIRGTATGASQERTVRLSERQILSLRIRDVPGGIGDFYVALGGAVEAGQYDSQQIPNPQPQNDGSVNRGRGDTQTGQNPPYPPDGRSQIQITIGTRKHGNITVNFDVKDELLKKLLSNRKDSRP